MRRSFSRLNSNIIVAIEVRGQSPDEAVVVFNNGAREPYGFSWEGVEEFEEMLRGKYGDETDTRKRPPRAK